MPNLYDRLNDLLDDENDKKSAGLTPLDIAELPDEPRRVMFAMLRNPTASSKGLSYDDLHSKLGDLDNLEGILADLVRQSWLIQIGEPPSERYKINLRRKRGSSLSMWTSLSDVLGSSDDE